MSAEDYDDIPGLDRFMAGFQRSNSKADGYQCKFCRSEITFKQRKPFNPDGTPHRCKSGGVQGSSMEEKETPPQAVLFAMSAMNAIVNASIQAGGVDYIHHMNFYDVADASWRLAAAMVSSEKQFRREFGDEA